MIHIFCLKKKLYLLLTFFVLKKLYLIWTFFVLKRTGSTWFKTHRLLVFLNSLLKNSQMLLIKLICLALLIPLWSMAQRWDVRIHSDIRCCEQPTPRENSISPNVPTSLTSFFWNNYWLSCGQVDNG